VESRDLRDLPREERLEWAAQYPIVPEGTECGEEATYDDYTDTPGLWMCTLDRAHKGIHVAHYPASDEWPHGEPLAYWVLGE
jgi:hypothetical protein